VDALFILSRHRDPEWNVLSTDLVRRFAERWFDYYPDLAAPPAGIGVRLEHVGHWAQRGQWVDVYAANRNRRERHEKMKHRRVDASKRDSGRPIYFLRNGSQPVSTLATLDRTAARVPGHGRR
jgi:hypothetical protein